MGWLPRSSEHARRFADIYRYMARIDGGPSLSTSTPSHWPEDGSLDGPRMARQLEYSVSVKRSMKILKDILEGAVSKTPGERQSEALSETHQGSLLYPNSTLYWEDWSGSISSLEKSLRDWLPMLLLWTESRDS